MRDGDLLAKAQAKIDALKTLKGNGAADAGEPLKFLTLEEFVQRPDVSTYVGRVIPARALVVAFGPPKEGKSFCVCDLTMHAAHGIDWFGCKVTRPLRVAYLAGEGVNGLRVRLKAWLEHHDSLTQPGLFRILPVALSLPDRVTDVVEQLREFAPEIVVTDTLNVYFGGGDENTTMDMTAFCAAVRYLRDELGCSVVIIHHTGHGDSGRERGSIVLRATVDVLIQIAKDAHDKSLVGFQVITARDIEAMETPLSLRLVRYETEWADDDGVPLVTCIVQGADQPVTFPGRGGRPLGEAQSAVLQAAQELDKAQKSEPNGEVFLARMDVAKLAKERGVSKQAISAAWASLAKRHYLRLVEPGSLAIRVSR
jgi:hypothetical protein